MIDFSQKVGISGDRTPANIITTEEYNESYDKNFLVSKPTKKETFPVDVRLNINTASARQIADALPGVGLKTARDIKDLQSTMLGDKFIKLEQLKSIKRVDWDELIKENLIRVE